MRKLFSMLAGMALFASAGSLHAAIIGGGVTGGTAFFQGAVFTNLTVPLGNPFGPANSVGNNTFQSPNLYGFDEDQNIVLAATLGMNVGADLFSGATVASHYIFFDPNESTSIQGYVDFDSQVLGIITSTGLLTASDFLANSGVNYLSPTLRGLENVDMVWVSGANQISVNYRASTPGDYIRVITAWSPGGNTSDVPEPGTLVLLGSALLFGMTRVRRSR